MGEAAYGARPSPGGNCSLVCGPKPYVGTFPSAGNIQIRGTLKDSKLKNKAVSYFYKQSGLFQEQQRIAICDKNAMVKPQACLEDKAEEDFL